jgi:cobalamin biosynthesis Mg chelatase CobN
MRVLPGAAIAVVLFAVGLGASAGLVGAAVRSAATDTTPATTSETETVPPSTQEVTTVETTTTVVTTVTEPTPTTSTAETTTTSTVTPGTAAVVGAAAATKQESSTDWGWVAFGILAAVVAIFGVVWLWRDRSKKGDATA